VPTGEEGLGISCRHAHSLLLFVTMSLGLYTPITVVLLTPEVIFFRAVRSVELHVIFSFKYF